MKGEIAIISRQQDPLGRRAPANLMPVHGDVSQLRRSGQFMAGHRRSLGNHCLHFHGKAAGFCAIRWEGSGRLGAAGVSRRRRQAHASRTPDRSEEQNRTHHQGDSEFDGGLHVVIFIAARVLPRRWLR